jgi:hypothetical protein
LPGKSFDGISARNYREMAHLNRDLYDPFTPVLLCPFIEDVKAALDGVPDILESFLDSIALRMAPRKGRATDNITAIFRVILDDDFQIHLIDIRWRRYTMFWTRGIQSPGMYFFQ